MRSSSALAIVACVLALTGNAFGQSDVDRENAQQLYRAGNDARDHGDDQAALAKYKAAYQIYQTPVIGLALGKAEIALKQLIEARRTLAGIDALAKKPNESALTTAARVEAAKLATDLETRIPSIALKLRLATGAATPTITVDGAVVPEGALDVPRKVNPGSHVVVVASAGSQRRIDVTVAEGETKDVPIEVAAPLQVVETKGPPPTPNVTSNQPGATKHPSTAARDAFAKDEITIEPGTQANDFLLRLGPEGTGPITPLGRRVGSVYLTENEFVRRFASMTGSHDIDGHDRNRHIGWLIFAGVCAAAIPVGVPLVVDGLSRSGTPPQTKNVGEGAVGLGLSVGGAGLGIMGLVFGIFGTGNDRADHDLTEAETKSFVDRYNRALKKKVLHEVDGVDVDGGGGDGPPSRNGAGLHVDVSVGFGGFVVKGSF